ncbi:MAG TPA: trypsin-like peptidase domain-containing protein [Acidimicrobiia bacterium]|nr:trypsin-like peptidase domain-containing protein [Acidimicrobiia bacterium]
MEPDDEDAPEPYRSPDDRERIWLHPSELGSLLPPVTDAPRHPAGHRHGGGRGRGLIIPVLSGMIGAALSLGILALAGALNQPPARVVERVTNLPVYDLAAPEGISHLAAAVAPTIVGLRATTPSGERFGSGVIFRSDGHVLTNFHLVDGATSIELSCSDGTSHPARQAGADPESDLAVLSMDDANMEPAVLGSARPLKVGQTAIVVGAPTGPQGSPSVSAGVIAGIGEVVEVAGRSLYDMISTDALIGHRASGGPLVDRSGAVVGITTRVAGGDHGHVIPIDHARRVAEKLLADGRVTYPWLGVSGTDLDPWTAKEYGVGAGTLIRRVSPKSPAEKSGLRVQDVVTAIENRPIATLNELMMLVRRHEPGDRVELTVVRSGVKQTLKVRLVGTPDGG